MHSDPIVRRLFACVVSRVPVVMWGPPGTGKTARVFSLQSNLGIHLERWLLSRCEPIDLKPRIYHGDKIVVARPPELERLADAPLSDLLQLRGILFLDEFNRSARETEGAALDIVDNPPSGVAVIAACNPPSRGQATRSLESAAANRFCHLDVEADHNAWATAQVAGWGGDEKGAFDLPSGETLRKAETRARTLVSAFIRRKKDLLEAPPDNPVAAGKAWPSTRTWEAARRLHATAMALGLGPEDLQALIAGCVGDGAAIEYMTFIQDADLPDPEELLADPKSYTPPKGRVDKTVTALTGVAGALESKLDDARWKASWVLVQRCLDADQADAAIVGGDMFLACYNRKTKRSPEETKGLTPPHKLMPNRMAQLLVGN